MLDISKLPEYVKRRVAEDRAHVANHAERSAKEFIGVGYKYGKDEAEKELVAMLRPYVVSNHFVQLLIDKLEDPDR